jgi:hypothetical protein
MLYEIMKSCYVPSKVHDPGSAVAIINFFYFFLEFSLCKLTRQYDVVFSDKSNVAFQCAVPVLELMSSGFMTVKLGLVFGCSD